MSEEIRPPAGTAFPERRYFEDLAVGESFYIPSRTITEAHFAAFQTVSADNHPIHYDIEYCRERGHPGPLAHGFQICASPPPAPATLRHTIGDALIGFTEQSSKFLKPVFAGGYALPDARDHGARPRSVPPASLPSQQRCTISKASSC